MMSNNLDALDSLDDSVAAAAFRRLVRHLRHRHDAQNIELMGLAGFCRNCLADWIREAKEQGAALGLYARGKSPIGRKVEVHGEVQLLAANSGTRTVSPEKVHSVYGEPKRNSGWNKAT